MFVTMLPPHIQFPLAFTWPTHASGWKKNNFRLPTVPFRTAPSPRATTPSSSAARPFDVLAPSWELTAEQKAARIAWEEEEHEDEGGEGENRREKAEGEEGEEEDDEDEEESGEKHANNIDEEWAAAALSRGDEVVAGRACSYFSGSPRAFRDTQAPGARVRSARDVPPPTSPHADGARACVESVIARGAVEFYKDYVAQVRDAPHVTHLVNMLRAQVNGQGLRREMRNRHERDSSLYGMVARDVEVAFALYLESAATINPQYVLEAARAVQVRFSALVVDRAVHRLQKNVVLMIAQQRGPGRSGCSGIPDASLLALLRRAPPAILDKKNLRLRPLEMFTWLWHEFAWSERAPLADACVRVLLEQMDKVRKNRDVAWLDELRDTLRRLELVPLAVHAAYVPSLDVCERLVSANHYHQYVQPLLARRLLPDTYAPHLLTVALRSNAPRIATSILHTSGRSAATALWSPDEHGRIARARPELVRAMNESAFVRSLGLLPAPAAPTSASRIIAAPVRMTYSDPHALPSLIAPGCTFLLPDN